MSLVDPLAIENRMLREEVRKLRVQVERIRKLQYAIGAIKPPPMMSSLFHTPPNPLECQANEAKEPLGEHLRKDLTAWVESNDILSVRLDTDSHFISIDYGPTLPSRIKNVLSCWGSIYTIER